MPPDNTTRDQPLPYLGGQIGALQQRIATANTPGSLDGLFARYILGESADFAWHVDPMGVWLESNSHRLEETSVVAILGYGLSEPSTRASNVKPQVRAGLAKLMQRDPFPADRLSFLHDIRILFGVHLAAESVHAEMPDFRSWLQETLSDRRLQPADTFHDLAQRHVHAALTGERVKLGNPHSMADGRELAVASWMINQGTAVLGEPANDARALQQLVMSAVMSADPSELTVPEAAILLKAATDVLESTVDQLVLSRSHVGLVLGRFAAAMRRWRWDSDQLQHPIRWEVRSEREIQDILWIMLRSTFDDVIDEDTLPKFGHSSYRADFGLPRLGVLIEVKYAYKDADFKKIEHEVMIDSVAYLQNVDRYKEIVVFIYDESPSVEHHDLTRATLLSLEGVTEVIIASRPGILPLPVRTRRADSGTS